MSVVVPVAVAVVAVALLLGLRRPRDPKVIAHSIPIADRLFLADELERITLLPTNTEEDVVAWYAATEDTQRRLRERFSDVASVVPHRLHHYFTDTDIHQKEPSYRASQEAPILEFIRLLRDDSSASAAPKT